MDNELITKALVETSGKDAAEMTKLLRQLGAGRMEAGIQYLYSNAKFYKSLAGASAAVAVIALICCGISWKKYRDAGDMFWELLDEQIQPYDEDELREEEE